MTTSGMLDGGGVKSLSELRAEGDATRRGVCGILVCFGLQFSLALDIFGNKVSTVEVAFWVVGFDVFVLVKALVILFLGFAEGSGFLPAFFFGFESFPVARFADANESGICFNFVNG
jgi:hypothetical protein